uniref:Uncharacterized protein n=1 Tax=Hemiselmis andersenii TaxID=464988 RepID=A0A6T8NCK2_HEMAN
MDDPLGVHVGGMGGGGGGEDPELAAIRAKRMAQLRGSAPGGAGGLPPGMSGMPPGMMGGMGGGANAKEQQEKQKAADEQRAQILKAVLTAGARERLANIAMVKAEKARRIEDMIITQAGRGAIDGVLEEEQLIQMLESISEAENKGRGTGKITIQRKRMDDDDDW